LNRSFEIEEGALSPIVKCKEIQSLVNVGLNDSNTKEEVENPIIDSPNADEWDEENSFN